jgi:hypothetical protein
MVKPTPKIGTDSAPARYAWADIDENMPIKGVL